MRCNRSNRSIPEWRCSCSSERKGKTGGGKSKSRFRRARELAGGTGRGRTAGGLEFGESRIDDGLVHMGEGFGVHFTGHVGELAEAAFEFRLHRARPLCQRVDTSTRLLDQRR